MPVLLRGVGVVVSSKRVREAGAEGIGLYRSEFLLDRPGAEAPSEDAQVGIYRALLEAMHPMPVTIRTFDVEEPEVERQPDGSVVVSARYSLDDANELLDAQLPEGPWDTVGGLMLDLAGRVPHQGEAVDVGGFRLVAERVQGRRIGRVRIERRPVVEAPSAGD